MEVKMRVFITGATGFIGSHHLVPALLGAGHEVSIVSRAVEKAGNVFGRDVEVHEGDPGVAGPWQEAAGKAEAIINLCGEPILTKKWTPERKKAILDSRVLPTRRLLEAIEAAPAKPKTLLSGSAIGYYSDCGDEIVTEERGRGADWGAELCATWEREANKATALGVRVVNLRTGIVLGADGGALPTMVKPMKMFAGGPIASGRQYMSWVHIDDWVGIALRALSDEKISGPVNLTAPNPVRNREFAKTLGKVVHRPSWLPTPAFVFRLMFGEGAALVVGGQRVIPRRALDAGYKFKFENLEAALEDVLV